MRWGTGHDRDRDALDRCFRFGPSGDEVVSECSAAFVRSNASTGSDSATTAFDQTTSTTEAPSYTRVPTDFKLDVVTLRKQCFGSAGCNVSYRVQIKYLGAKLPDATKTFDVVYNVTGAESPVTNHFTVTGSIISSPSEESTSTTSDGAVLVATPTSVLPG